ncbi:phage regulatory protein, Rha family (plasmid) [Campylobacter novaezeelandiae]|nr:phage regulatory protein, Rha family [Campylobacter novaezeelandiae]
MSKSMAINNQEVIFENKENQIFCTSLDVAKVFGKRHDHVLRDIENILNDLREIGTSQDILNFGEVVRISKTTNPKNGKLVSRKMPMYNLTRDGFSLLAMGFTGKKALQWKIAFINAFNEMEKLLQKEIRSPNKYLTEIMSELYKRLPQEDFSVDITLKDRNQNNKIIFSHYYEVGGIPKDPMVNKNSLKNLKLMAKKDVITGGRDAHIPYTQAQSLDGRLVQKNISSANDRTIPQKDKPKIMEFKR